jgi:hypothetical protein
MGIGWIMQGKGVGRFKSTALGALYDILVEIVAEEQIHENWVKGLIDYIEKANGGEIWVINFDRFIFSTEDLDACYALLNKVINKAHMTFQWSPEIFEYYQSILINITSRRECYQSKYFLVKGHPAFKYTDEGLKSFCEVVLGMPKAEVDKHQASGLVEKIKSVSTSGKVIDIDLDPFIQGREDFENIYNFFVLMIKTTEDYFEWPQSIIGFYKEQVPNMLKYKKHYPGGLMSFAVKASQFIKEKVF